MAPEDQEAIDVWQSLNAELRDVVRALPELPDAVREGIVAMVKVASAKK